MLNEMISFVVEINTSVMFQYIALLHSSKVQFAVLIEYTVFQYFNNFSTRDSHHL